MPNNERMMQDYIRLCGALGLDADAHIDMLAEAAERLRAECERLKARGIEGMQYRIAELKATLREVQDSATFHADVLKNRGALSVAHHWRVEANRAAAALKETPNDEG